MEGSKAGFRGQGPGAGKEGKRFGNRVTLVELPGFEVKLDSSWIVLAVLITGSLSRGIFPADYGDMPAANHRDVGVAGAMGLFLSVIFHELSHSPVARRFGIPTKGITLFIVGGMAVRARRPLSSAPRVSRRR